MKSIKITLLVFTFFVSSSHAQGGLVLTFPFGARSYSMGEVGTALADDASALYWNVAGLGITDLRPASISLANFYEPLLPAYGIPELWHSASALNITLPKNWGSVEIFHNYLNLGINSVADELGRETARYKSYEQAFSVGWGWGFQEIGDSTDYFGVALKILNSNPGPANANSFAFDAGYIRRFKNGLHLGINLQNMGPSIQYEDGYKGPIPFTLNLAIGIRHEIPCKKLNLFQIAWETRLSKELVVFHEDQNPDPFYKAFFTDWTDSPFNKELQQINYNSGVEIGVLNTGYFRHGYLIDIAGERYELHWGIGMSLFNHLNFDFGIIHSPEGYMKNFARNFNKDSEGASGARDAQWQISSSFYNLNFWSSRDRHWWRCAGN